ncbi:hypothetical protein NL676_023978 [Syzygium grande]|nr:hypothetical protein NL676_023978 [Syzygium grande]
MMIKVALMCTNATPALRPPMSSVASMLEGKVAVPVLGSDGAILTKEKIEAMRKHFKGDEDEAASENITKSMSPSRAMDWNNRSIRDNAATSSHDNDVDGCHCKGGNMLWKLFMV